MAQEAQIKITADTSSAERALGSLNSALRGIAGIALGSGIGRELIDIIGDIQTLSNKLISVTKNTQEANQRFSELAAVAKQTGANLGGTIDLFQKMGQSEVLAGKNGELLAGNAEAMQLAITNLNKALVINGTSAEGVRSVLYNLGQAYQNGTLQGNDFRALQENAGYVLNNLAKFANKSRSEVKILAEEGRLDIGLFTQSLIDGGKINEDYARTIHTIPNAIENLKTSFLEIIKYIDDVTGVGNLLVDTLEQMAKGLGPILVAAAVVGVGALAYFSAAWLPLVAGVAAAIAPFAIVGGLIGILGGLFYGMNKFIKEGIGLWDSFTATLDTFGAGVAKTFGIEYKTSQATEDAIKKVIAAEEKLKKATTPVLTTADVRGPAAEKLDTALREQIAKLKLVNDAEEKQNGIKNLNLEVEKAMSTEIAKYDKIKKSMLPNDAAAFKLEEQRKILLSERTSLEKQILDLKSQFVTLGIIDIDQQKIAQDMEKFRLSVTNETYTREKDRLENQLKLNQAKEIEMGYTRLTSPESNSQVAGRAGSIFGSTNAGVTIEANRQQEALNALKSRGLVSDQTFAEQEILINKTKTDAILANEQAVAEARMKLAGVTNDTIIAAVKDQMANVKMMQMGGVQGAQGVLGALDNVFASMSAHNKQAFEAHKALATAQAIISTYQAAAEAIAFPPGPPISFVYVAGAIAAGFAQVAAIQGQQYSGRAIGGSVMGGSPYIVGEKGPELFTPASSGMITPNDKLGGGGPVAINFNIQANDAQGFDDLLHQRKGMITQFVRDAMQEHGQRSRI